MVRELDHDVNGNGSEGLRVQVARMDERQETIFRKLDDIKSEIDSASRGRRALTSSIVAGLIVGLPTLTVSIIALVR
jgi:hypothetical protein